MRYVPGDQTWNHINLYQTILNSKGYILSNSSFINIKVVDFNIIKDEKNQN